MNGYYLQQIMAKYLRGFSLLHTNNTLPHYPYQQTANKTMNAVVCSVCKRKFAKNQYFVQHFSYAKNIECQLEFQRRLNKLSPDKFTPLGSTPPTKTVATLPKSATSTTQERARRPLNFGEPTESPHVETVEDEHFEDGDFPTLEDDGHFLNVGNPEQHVVPPFLPANAVDNVNCANRGHERSKIRVEFNEFIRDSLQNRGWLNIDMQAGIELMSQLQKNGAIHLYDSIMDWHLTYLEAKKRVTKNQLMESLRKRHGMEQTKPFIYRLNLPVSGVKARIPCHDAWAMMKDLLTEPKIVPEDYLWFDGHPMSQPPAEWLNLRDINDGLAYRETYKAKILPQPYTECGRRRVLLPIILYMDGCVTGFNENLAIEFVKFTLGIFTSKAREKEYTWRNLGAVPQFMRVRAKAAELLQKSGHLNANEYLSMSESEGEDTPNIRKFTTEFDVGPYINSSDDEEDMCDVPFPETEAQDLHVVLQVIMSGMKKIMETGFEWDFYHNSEIQRLFFVPFLLFLKGDTVEHDKHCGHYGARNRGVACLCRYCVCPTADTDEPYKDFARKSPEMMTRLVQKNDLAKLKTVSQQDIFNVWYEFEFGSHNKLGIHGACPMELLHWIQLGIYKYGREALFGQFGPYSQLSQRFNELASQMGYLFQRQSDRAYPRTKFTKGVQKGTLMAHEMTGLMLVLVATLRSSAGEKAILESNNDNFQTPEAISSWILLLETLLEFESWLKSSEMSVPVVFRLRTKVRELMTLIKVVGRRDKGMGYKTNNFHATKHVPEDILMFGPPHCVNTKSNEMNHKPDKKSAKSTQKRPATFDMQCTERVEERRVIQTGMEEMKGRPKWDYFVGFNRQDQHRAERFGGPSDQNFGIVTPKSQKRAKTQPSLGGVRAVFMYDDEEGGYKYKVFSAMKRKSRYCYPQEIADAIADLAEECTEYAQSLSIFSELHQPNGPNYRASPFFQGKPWYDWAMCIVGEQIEDVMPRIVPVHIRCFVDLTFLPTTNNTTHSAGLYMIVEPTRLYPVASEIQKSDLFVPYLKEEGLLTPTKLLLLPVDRIVSPTVVIPDVGHPSKRAFFRVRPMAEWNCLFEAWVNSPHMLDHQEPGMVE